jgi:hypothetical protein
MSKITCLQLTWPRAGDGGAIANSIACKKTKVANSLPICSVLYGLMRSARPNNAHT